MYEYKQLTFTSPVVWVERIARLSLASSCSLANTGGEGVSQGVWSPGVTITMDGREDLVDENLLNVSVIAGPKTSIIYIYHPSLTQTHI